MMIKTFTAAMLCRCKTSGVQNPYRDLTAGCIVKNIRRGRQAVICQSFVTARRNARIASSVLAIPIPSVCLSVTRRYCVKSTARSTVQFALSDSKNMPTFLQTKKIFQRDDPFPLISWLKLTHTLQVAVSFDTFCLVAPQR